MVSSFLVTQWGTEKISICVKPRGLAAPGVANIRAVTDNESSQDGKTHAEVSTPRMTHK